MIRIRSGTVTGVVSDRPGARELTAALADGAQVRALAYGDLTGLPDVGDRVLLNLSALDRALGTGGLALVVALPDRSDGEQPAGAAPDQPGHVMKARYTPLQTMVLGVDEQESPHHALLADADDLDGMPVVVADLHSALPAIVAAVHLDRPGTRVAYVMTDGGALPVAFSQTVAALREGGELVACLSVGQAYGGDHEAVTVHSALLAARLVCRADLTVVAQGPGNLGTGTRWGFSGVVAGEAVNATAVLGGRPVAALRVSEADPRERHRGISHHSRTSYGRVALVPADLPVPVLDGPIGAQVSADADALVASSVGRLTRYDVPLDGLPTVLRESRVPLRTMGRSYDDDPAGFLASAAAGRHAASLLDEPRESLRVSPALGGVT